MDTKWIPLDGDVHLRIWLADTPLDYATTATAARHFVDDCERRHWYTLELVDSTVAKCRLLPRLPCERLFDGP